MVQYEDSDIRRILLEEWETAFMRMQGLVLFSKLLVPWGDSRIYFIKKFKLHEKLLLKKQKNHTIIATRKLRFFCALIAIFLRESSEYVALIFRFSTIVYIYTCR